MKNAYIITDIAEMMRKSCEAIGGISLSINNAEQNNNEDLTETLKGIMLRELENIQRMVLTLTQAVTEAANNGVRQDDAGSVFMQGELNDDLGKKDHPDGVAVDYVDPDEEEK